MHLGNPVLVCVVVLHCSLHVLASRGDRLWDYKMCLESCSTPCRDKSYASNLALSLRVFGWSCVDECKYQCMHEITARAIERNRQVFQYYGKWPFIRLLGIQEPASTFFSICNGIAHIFGWHKFREVIPSYHKMYGVWRGYLLINLNAWFWSSVFHARDLDWTEKLDYFGATSLVLCSILCFFVRVVGPERKRDCYSFGAILCVVFVCHMIYLGFIKMDYSYNMKANVTIGILNMTGWILWCLLHLHQQPYVWKCICISTCVFFLVGLEVFDFSPLWLIFDAHSIWHLSTIPFCYFWYSFIIDDCLYLMKEDKRKAL